MLIASCLVSFCAGSTFAQAPADQLLYPPPSAIETVPLPMASLGAPVSTATGNMWTSADYMFSWFKGTQLGSLVTTSPTGTPANTAGVLGRPGTQTLFGGRHEDNVRSGFRLGAGLWLDQGQTFGVEASFMMMESQAALFSTMSNSSLILARPFTDSITGLPQAVLVAFPGASRGSIDVRAASGNLYSGNLDLVEKFYDGGWLRFNALAGYRYYSYHENLGIRQSISPTGPNFIPGTNLASVDNFSTRNEFHGFDMGIRSEFVMENLSMELLGRLALGDLHTRVAIGGFQTVSVPGTTPITRAGGVYALGTNSAIFNKYRLSTMPEFGATLKWQVSQSLQLRFGYSVLNLDGVARAANQVNTTINPANFPPATSTIGGQPSFFMQRSQLWIQNMTIGLVFTF